jgi:murein DD-endopeptidase MepM/ murein hydrolase activator NlpD
VKRGVSVVTTYNHLSRFVVSAGAKVKRGQTIAYSGSTGYSTGCHLHFMVLANGSTVNPVGWL